MPKLVHRWLGPWMAVTVLATVATAGCDPTGDSPKEVGKPDATLRTHAVDPSTPTPEGLVYLRSVADVHADADARTGDDRRRALRRGLALPVPAGLAEAEIMRLDLAARLGEELLADPHGARAARELLQPMLTVERSLPLDRATARALVVLGDAAVKTGDDALAAGSYARSIEMMSLLRQELEP
ncbi:MAG: hypothetical protein AAF799_08690 [Myxococcota bacterium]